MKIDGNTSVGSIVGENFKTAKIFENSGIDFCCGGDQSMKEACAENKVDMDILIDSLELEMQESDPETEFIKRLELDELVDYIIKRHHSFVLEQIPVITQLLEKIASVHGDAHPEVFTIKSEFEEATKNLSGHLDDEEQKLFPYIKSLVAAQKSGQTFEAVEGFSLKALLEGMLDEHTAEGDRFDKLSKLTNNYEIPADVCNTFVVSFKSVKAFQDDLHRHVHLENNMLFPKALKLEAELLG
ncbi:MAG: iron-sulfur cluster repair di-iron protein [Bacteroidales bacterium]|nr:iron-sulfur cluster repair di-iron protein [Bacteroidales bacterium]